jgi:hypothetical protein
MVPNKACPILFRVHHTDDDGGLDLMFYWHPVNRAPDHEWHALFQRALLHILHRLNGGASASSVPDDRSFRCRFSAGSPGTPPDVDT